MKNFTRMFHGGRRRRFARCEGRRPDFLGEAEEKAEEYGGQNALASVSAPPWGARNRGRCVLATIFFIFYFSFFCGNQSVVLRSERSCDMWVSHPTLLPPDSFGHAFVFVCLTSFLFSPVFAHRGTTICPRMSRRA